MQQIKEKSKKENYNNSKFNIYKWDVPGEMKSCLYIRIPKTGSTSFMHKIRRVRNSSGKSLDKMIYTNLYDKIYANGLDWSNNQLLEFRDKLSCEIFEKLYKFSFVRDPFSRAVSSYSYLQRRKFRPLMRKHNLFNLSFESFWEKVYESNINIICPDKWDDLTWHLSPMYIHLQNENKKIAVDFVGKVETIKSDFNKICTRLNAGHIVHFPKLRSSPHKEIVSYYNDVTQELIVKIYERDFEEFQYEKTLL